MKTPAAMAGGLGSGVILIWVLSLNGITVPNEVAAAIGGALMPLVAWAGDLLSVIGRRIISAVEPKE